MSSTSSLRGVRNVRREGVCPSGLVAEGPGVDLDLAVTGLLSALYLFAPGLSGNGPLDPTSSA